MYTESFGGIFQGGREDTEECAELGGEGGG